MNRKALALLSGGLDSTLAIKVLQEQGIEVEAVNYVIKFAACIPTNGENAATKAARMLNVPIKVVDITEEYLSVLRNPKHGYGANINPCIDCKIFMLKKAKEHMLKIGASFLVTGEVLGERPMSQRKDALAIIERDADVRGILLRPLSAKALDPTTPEKEGVVDRRKLLDIKGRSRRPQMALAAKFGITEYPNPAGGCLLTDPGFTRRVKDLIDNKEFNTDDLTLLTVGRHFRLAPGAKLAIGRDRLENDKLEKQARAGDISFMLTEHQGPLGLLRGKADTELIRLAAELVAYHTKLRNEPSVKVGYWAEDPGSMTTLTVKPAAVTEVERYRL
jgi:tRNA U34 2-thiouridine synthase MnmA/TrmU